MSFLFSTLQIPFPVDIIEKVKLVSTDIKKHASFNDTTPI